MFKALMEAIYAAAAAAADEAVSHRWSLSLSFFFSLFFKSENQNMRFFLGRGGVPPLTRRSSTSVIVNGSFPIGTFFLFIPHIHTKLMGKMLIYIQLGQCQ